MANIPSNLATRDIESLVHPYTNLAPFVRLSETKPPPELKPAPELASTGSVPLPPRRPKRD
jgi:hypothetical protein